MPSARYDRWILMLIDSPFIPRSNLLANPHHTNHDLRSDTTDIINIILLHAFYSSHLTSIFPYMLPHQPHYRRHNGRVVKASDLKSDGLCPRRFKSCLCRFTQYAQDNITSVIGSVVEYNVANVVARVRFPDDA